MFAGLTTAGKPILSISTCYVCTNLYIRGGGKIPKPMKKFILLLSLGIAWFMPGPVAPAQTMPEGNFLRFNGVDQYMVIPHHSDFNLSPGESFTLTCRIRPDDFNDHYSLLSKGNLLMNGAKYELSTLPSLSTPNLSLKLNNSENASLGAPYITILTAGSWVHLAWIYNASDHSSSVYADGDLVQKTVNPAIGGGTIRNAHDLTIGCGWSDFLNPTHFQFWPGLFDELRIWKRALSAEEIWADRNAARADSSGLVGYWDFGGINCNIVPDRSGKGHHGQIYRYGIHVINTELPVGAGEVNERLTAFRIQVNSAGEKVKNIKVDLSRTTNVRDLLNLKAYYNGTSERLDLKTATLFGTVMPKGTKAIITGDIPLLPGENYFWITADISPFAKEGNLVHAGVTDYTSGYGVEVCVPRIPGSRTILLASKLLFSAGDGGSKHYRIPSIVTARDGSLVTATDKRWNNQFDLPNHIDVVIRRSTDKGRNWSHPLTIAGEGTGTGFGDASLVLNRRNGDIICLFAGGTGFNYSTAEVPIRVYQSKSSDNGISWSTPRDITPMIYGTGCLNPVSRNWQGAFVSSGSAAQLKSGRLMAVMPVRETGSRAISNFVLYSDDGAATWKASVNPAAINGNEGKVVEMEDRNVLMSIRNRGNRLFNISKDQGMTWGSPFPQHAITDPYCNGDLIRYTSVSEGYFRNRLLHSIPFANSRRNVSVLLSYDEGETWPVRKTIFPGVSGYSSLTVLNDGTIGVYYEVGEYETYQLYFVRFSLSWLSDRNDTWSEKMSPVISGSSGIASNPHAITLYPNPAEGIVNVSGNFELNASAEIYDSQGKLMVITRISNPGGPVRISLAGLPSGIYYLKIGGETSKFMVKN